MKCPPHERDHTKYSDRCPAPAPSATAYISGFGDQLRKLEERYRLGRSAIRWIGIIILAWLGKDAIIAFAGHSTSLLVQAGLSVFADLRVSISLALAGSCAAWAVLERVIRQKRVEQLHKRVKELETGIDPQRSSSRLTPKGKTNPRDRSV